eukprot:TRINITY_DN8381_c0_g1_i1.p1 TRINITY_DN8381_c0_g1~~TRINITY_DN8381_c0_g1_i1.p1  ORF type:complete len:414 (-),score=46.44 TRINITY_DN8381_c0_g1_i1:60-1301(-)
MAETQLYTSSNGRYFVHRFPESSPHHSVHDLITPELLAELKGFLEKDLKRIYESQPPKDAKHGISIYHGTGGVLYCFQRLSRAKTLVSLNNRYSEAVSDYFKYSLDVASKSKSPDKKRITFHCGDMGIFVNYAISHPEESSSYISKVLEKYPIAMDPSFESNELLYGRVGYLASLIILWKQFGDDKISSKLITDLITLVIAEGRKMGTSSCPLIYEWHGRKYWGAAHGTTGILVILLSVHEQFVKPNEGWVTDVRKTIDYLLDQYNKEPSGNFPSRKNGSTSLVQWCHGAPAIIFLLSRAYSIWKEPMYRTGLEKAATIVFQQGLLTKGGSLCHGVSGNAYALLAVYNSTSDVKYLHQVLCIVRAHYSQEFQENQIPGDDPFSLYGGLSGMACLLIDLLEDPTKASFPAYQEI